MFDLPDFSNLHIFDELPSTSDYLLAQCAKSVLPSGYAVQALKQTAGRGRYNRVWEDKGGNLALSFLLKPQNMEQKIGQLSITIAVSAYKTMLKLGVKEEFIRLKWPNDILIDEKKSSGFLIEKSEIGYVVGIGVNITSAPEERNFLNNVVPSPIQVPEFVNSFFAVFQELYTQLQQGDFETIKQMWLAQAQLIDRKITLKLRDESFSATAKGLDPNGALIVERADNKKEQLITSAEIFD